MSDYHVFQCDRCGHPVKGVCTGAVPQYWAKITIDFSGSNPARKSVELCGSCYSLVDSLIRNARMELIDTSIYERALIAKVAEVQP